MSAEEVDETDPFGGPLRHLKRLAPPWAAAERTVCGRPLSDVGQWMDFDAAKTLVDRIGRARSQFVFCQTCLMNHQGKTAQATWDSLPHRVVTDWAEKAGWRGVDDGGQIKAEILALADLVAAHRDEYDALVTIRLTPDALAARRQTKRRA